MVGNVLKMCKNVFSTLIYSFLASGFTCWVGAARVLLLVALSREAAVAPGHRSSGISRSPSARRPPHFCSNRCTPLAQRGAQVQQRQCRVQQSLGLVFDPDRGEHSLEHPTCRTPAPRVNHPRFGAALCLPTRETTLARKIKWGT